MEASIYEALKNSIVVSLRALSLSLPSPVSRLQSQESSLQIPHFLRKLKKITLLIHHAVKLHKLSNKANHTAPPSLLLSLKQMQQNKATDPPPPPLPHHPPPLPSPPSNSNPNLNLSCALPPPSNAFAGHTPQHCPPARGAHHRRARSEVAFRIPDDLDLSSGDPVSTGSFDEIGSEDDLFSTFMDIEKISSKIEGSGSGSEGGGFNRDRTGESSGGGNRSANGNGVPRPKHRHSNSIDGSAMVGSGEPGGLFSEVLEAKKAMSSDQLAELAAIDPKRAKRYVLFLSEFCVVLCGAQRCLVLILSFRKNEHISELNLSLILNLLYSCAPFFLASAHCTSINLCNLVLGECTIQDCLLWGCSYAII